MNKIQVRELKKLSKEFSYNDLRQVLSSFRKNIKGKKSDLVIKLCDLIDESAAKNNPECSTLAAKIYETSKKVVHKSNRTIQSVNKKLLLSQGQKVTRVSPSFSQNTPILDDPNVVMKSLPFYDIKAQLVKPTLLISKSDIHLSHYGKYSFSLTPAQVKQIRDSQVLTNGCVVEYQQQVLLRFCLAEVTSDQDDNYPLNLFLNVNQQSITLPSFNFPTNALAQPKRLCRPLDITSACVIKPVNLNDIHMTWTDDPLHKHCFSVVLAQRLSCEILLKRLKSSSFHHPDHTRAFVKQKLAASMDSEISFTCLKISLMCPLSKMKMKVPIRSKSCNHLQCFDASTFLQMNEKKPTWVCPICDKTTQFESLIVDGLFLEILDQAPNATEIQFLEDGSWKEIGVKKIEEKAIASVSCFEILDSSSNDSRDTIVQLPKENNETVIDLTAESDEEVSQPDELNLDSISNLSSSPSVLPYDLSKNKLDDLRSPTDLPCLDSPRAFLTTPVYKDPPDLIPM